MLFLQAAGSDYNSAHDLVSAVTEAIRAPYVDPAAGSLGVASPPSPSTPNGRGLKRLAFKSEQFAARLERAGYAGAENLQVALAVHLTTDSPASDIDWIASTASRIGDANMLLETAGVLFAFNTINRIADARRVQLEYQFLRGLKPIQGWLERRLASLAGVLYDLSFKHRPRYSSAALMDRLAILLERLGSPVVPEVFQWLSRSPVVLEGVLEMIDTNVTSARVRSDLLNEAMAIGVASRAMPGSGMTVVAEQWLPQEALCDPKALRAWAAPPGGADGANLVSACRRYAWQVANAAYTITDEQILKLYTLGLSDAELLDLTLATAVFSALAIIEPISMVAEAGGNTSESSQIHQVQVA